MSIEEIIAPLRELWSKTKVDWDLRITQCITEPVCCHVTIEPEGCCLPKDLHLSSSGDTIEEAVKAAVDKAKAIFMDAKNPPALPRDLSYLPEDERYSLAVSDLSLIMGRYKLDAAELMKRYKEAKDAREKHLLMVRRRIETGKDPLSK